MRMELLTGSLPNRELLADWKAHGEEGLPLKSSTRSSAPPRPTRARSRRNSPPWSLSGGNDIPGPKPMICMAAEYYIFRHDTTVSSG